MYHEYYGFAKKPFSISPDPDFIYLNAYYKEALSMLRYGIEERKGVICLIGEVGTGKTMLLNKLLLSIRKELITPYVVFPVNGFEELVGDLIEQLEVPIESGHPTGKLQALQRHLLKESRRGRIVVLLVDEAQTLDVKALEGLRHLSNIETPKEKLIQIVLSGQPELKDKLNLVELRQFKQRIATSFELKPLPLEEVPLYIAHRMKVAGNTQVLRLFSEDALALVANYSGGIPRLINALCENALLIGYALEKRQIDGRIVREAAKDLMLGEVLSSDKPIDYDKPLEEKKKRTRSEKRAFSSKPEKTKGYGSFLKWAAVCLILFFMLVIPAVWFPRQASDIATSIHRLVTENFIFLKEHLSAGIHNNSKYPVVALSKKKTQFTQSISTKEKSLSGTPEQKIPDGVDSSGPKELKVIEEIRTVAPPVIDEEPVSNGKTEENLATETRVDIAGSKDRSADNELSILASNPDLVAEFHEIDMPGTMLLDVERKEPRAMARTIRPREMISGVALEIYGFLNSYVYAMIHLANPKIADLDLVMSGQTVLFPPLSLKARILPQNDNGYRIFVNACGDAVLAEEWERRLKREGATNVGIESAWITSKVKIYLLQIEGYQNRDEALLHLKALASTPSIAEIFEERPMPDSEVLAKIKDQHPASVIP